MMKAIERGSKGTGLFVELFLCFLGDVVVYKHAATVFADDDFLVHLDFALALGRDFAETATASVAVDGDDGKAVAGLFADAFVSNKVVLVDEFLLLGGFVAEAHFVLFGLFDDAVEFGLLGFELGIAFLYQQFGSGDVLFEFFDFVVGIAVATFAELDFEVLELDFLVDGFELAVVAHVVLLLLVLLDHGLVVGNVAIAFGDIAVLLGDVLLEVADACLEAGDFVFEVLNGMGQFATDDLDFVDFGVNQLKGVEGYETALGGNVDIGHLLGVLGDGLFRDFGCCDFFRHCAINININ